MRNKVNYIYIYIYHNDRQCYIHYIFNVVICLPFHIYEGVENILKHVLFYMYDAKVMAEKIDLPIRKLPQNNLLYLVVGQTKTRKLLLTRLETKHNAILH
jgi:hypothetical protein